MLRLAPIALLHVLSCGPDECADLVVYANDVLQAQEDEWVAEKEARLECEASCRNDHDDCMDAVLGGGDTGGGPVVTEEECDDEKTTCYRACPDEDDLEFPYSSSDYPLFSFSEPIGLLSIRIDYAKGLDDFYWSIECEDDTNCLTDPVPFHPMSENDEIPVGNLKEEEPFKHMTDGRFYTISAAITDGDGGGCVLREDRELVFEFRSGKDYLFD